MSKIKLNRKEIQSKSFFLIITSCCVNIDWDGVTIDSESECYPGLFNRSVGLTEFLKSKNIEVPEFVPIPKTPMRNIRSGKKGCGCGG